MLESKLTLVEKIITLKIIMLGKIDKIIKKINVRYSQVYTVGIQYKPD